MNAHIERQIFYLTYIDTLTDRKTNKETDKEK